MSASGDRQQRRPPPPPPTSRLPPLPREPPPPMYGFGSTDSYRPRDSQRGRHQQDFSFRVEDSRAPRYPRYESPPRQPRNDRHRSDHRPEYSRRNQGPPGRNERDRRPRRDFAGRGGRPFVPTHERPLLRSRRESTPEQLSGMAFDPDHHDRFMAIEDVSDSEEEDMDVESGDDGDEDPSVSNGTKVNGSKANASFLEADEPPRKKQQKAPGAESTDGSSVPKWSNPDPYTVLPPPDESHKKRKDVVKLIRKAKVPKPDDSKNTAVVNEDFISLDFDDDVNAEDSEDSEKPGPDALEQSPGRRGFSHLENLHGSTLSTATSAVPPTNGAPPGTAGNVVSASSLGPPPGLLVGQESTILKSSEASAWPPRSIDDAIPQRKRKHDDYLEDIKPMKKKRAGGKMPSTGAIVDEWQPCKQGSATPWCTVDHSRTKRMGDWLHQEICDFYEFVRPKEFEHVIRNELLDRMRAFVARKYQNCEVQCFGSFAAGLYLPNSDMDLVIMSHEFARRGRKTVFQNKKELHKLSGLLEIARFPVPGSMEVVASAKVPIVKFVDRLTGLRVDISFENDSGLVALKTFEDWKAQFPAMPVIVTVIKQLLMMRGLNEVFNGGVGGFAVTCLVTSLLQMMPQVQSGNMIPEHHLGEILMEFFDLYGNEFNREYSGIQLDPPGYFVKRPNGDRNYIERLTIIDPNNPDNNISQGSGNIKLILGLFSHGYNSLQRKMAELQNAEFSKREGQSILGTLLGGDYSSFEWQRNRLRLLYDERSGGDPLPEMIAAETKAGHVCELPDDPSGSTQHQVDEAEKPGKRKKKKGPSVSNNPFGPDISRLSAKAGKARHREKIRLRAKEKQAKKEAEQAMEVHNAAQDADRVVGGSSSAPNAAKPPVTRDRKKGKKALVSRERMEIHGADTVLPGAITAEESASLPRLRSGANRLQTALVPNSGNKRSNENIGSSRDPIILDQ